MTDYYVGQYIQEWVRCPEFPGQDGERRHLLFGQVAAIANGIPLLDDDTPLACGLRLGDGWWTDQDEAPKCERCRQIAEGDVERDLLLLGQAFLRDHRHVVRHMLGHLRQAATGSLSRPACSAPSF